jgi:hypothetical protein
VQSRAANRKALCANAASRKCKVFIAHARIAVALNQEGLVDLKEFQRSLAAAAPPAGTGKVLQALWHDAKGDWSGAHEIVQSVKGKEGARVHAYLHRKEADLDNANYWHERAGTTMPEVSLEQEWQMLVAELLDK